MRHHGFAERVPPDLESPRKPRDRDRLPLLRRRAAPAFRPQVYIDLMSCAVPQLLPVADLLSLGTRGRPASSALMNSGGSEAETP